MIDRVLLRMEEEQVGAEPYLSDCPEVDEVLKQAALLRHREIVGEVLAEN